MLLLVVVVVVVVWGPSDKDVTEPWILEEARETPEGL